jgi:hypothetical protein
MTIVAKFGRRIPKSLKSRVVHKIDGALRGQEYVWNLLKMTFYNNKKKFNQYLKGKFKPKMDGKIYTYEIDSHKENEDTFYMLEWMIVTLQGDKQGEEAEYKELLSMQNHLLGIIKNRKTSRDFSIEENKGLWNKFKTKMLEEEKLQEMFEKGKAHLGSERKDKPLVSVLLELGIMTNFEIIDDYASRPPTPDF